MKSIAIAAVAISAPLFGQSNAPAPTLSIADPSTLSRTISFAAPEPALRNLGSSKVLWRVNVSLPDHSSLKRAYMMGYAPIVIELKDDRCFSVDFNGASDKLTKVSLSRTTCSQDDRTKTASPAPSKPWLRYIGKAWNLNAWTDAQTGQTMLIPDQGANGRPVLTTSMHVIAVGGMGAPDAPMTEVSLVGYIDKQLVLSTVMLILP